MEPNKSESKKLISEDQPSINGSDSKAEALKMEEELARLLAAFERGKLRRARAESENNGTGPVMELLHRR